MTSFGHLPKVPIPKVLASNLIPTTHKMPPNMVTFDFERAGLEA